MALEQEPRLSFNIPAKWTNHFTVVKQPHGTRIAFAEAAPGEDKPYVFHSAVLMGHDAARALAEALLRVSSS